MYNFNSGSSCGCSTFPNWTSWNTGCCWGNNNNSSFAIILVLFILLVIVIGARGTR